MANVTVVTGEQVLTALRATVARVGPDTMRPPHYTYDMVPRDPDAPQPEPTPICIAATVLADLGVTMGSLREYEGFRVNEIFEHGVTVDGVGLDKNARRILREAQYRQDGSESWGEALHHAEAVARLYKDV